MSKTDKGDSVAVTVDASRDSYGYVDYPHNSRSPKMTTNSNLVYVNNAYVGSVNSVRSDRSDRLYEPPTTVIREQYWACSKWSFAQRVLAIAVGVLLGTVISLTVVITLNNNDKTLADVFRGHPAPD